MMATDINGTPLDPASAAAQLLDGIGKEMVESAGGEPKRFTNLTAQHEQEVKAAQSTALRGDKEEAKDAKPSAGKSDEKAILGIWKTEEDARKDLANIPKLINRVSELEQENQQLKASKNGKEPEPVKEESDAFADLENLTAIPREPLRKAVRAEAQNLLNELIQPQLERQNADRAIIKEFPEYEKEFDSLISFINENPQIQKDVDYAEKQGHYLLARKYAWTLYAAQKSAVTQDEKSGKVKERKEKIADTRPDAAMLGNGRSEERRPTVDGVKDDIGKKWPTPERMDYLTRMARDGHPDLLNRETIGLLLEAQGFPK